MSDLEITGNGCTETAIANVSGKIDATNLVIQGVYFGINARHLRGQNIDVSNNETYGLYVTRSTKVTGLTANGNGLGSAVSHFKGTNVVANGNGSDALQAGRFRGSNVEASNNAGAGVYTDRGAKIDGFTAVENDGPGFKSDNGGGRLTDATITSTLSTYDIETARRTILRGSSSCDRSLDTTTGGTWGICALD